MTSGELANACLEVCLDAQRRIITVGDEQYNVGGEQRFEKDSLYTHLKGLEEELLDTINHAAMSVLKLRMMREDLAR